MITFQRTNSQNDHFKTLVALLDAELSERDGAEHQFYHQFNKIDLIQHVIVAYQGTEPVGCGAIKLYTPDTMEIKRMFVAPHQRGLGIASMILEALENWTRELNIPRCILETGKKQPEAIRLYQKNNYTIIPNYGQYEGVENSLCFQKLLS
jgi:putative acetyltransferase